LRKNQIFKPLEETRKMLGIGISEILVILAIALIVLGPKEIPKVARTIGRIMREVQRTTDELRRTIDAEIEEENMKPEENKGREKRRNSRVGGRSTLKHKHTK
jgi:twin arginine-targeting protein translocase TatB